MDDLVPEAEAIKAHLSKDPKDYADFARRMIEKARENVVTKMEEKAEEKSAAKMQKLATILGLFSFSALLLFLLPFFMSKKYPGKMGILFKYSAIAAMVGAFLLRAQRPQGHHLHLQIQAGDDRRRLQEDGGRRYDDWPLGATPATA